MEVDEQGFAYRTVVLTVPRQGGKTQTVRVVTTWWGLSRVRNLIVSTAQSGLDARLKWGESIEDLEARSFFRRQMKRAPRRANGTEVVHWKSGTRHRPVPPIPRKGHGDTLDLGIIDEAWSFSDESVITAMRPAMMTRDSQLWIVSTAGTEDSILLRRHVEMGRRAVANGERSGIAYFEWSAEPDDDPDDPATWWSCIPTLGHTVSEERIRADKQTLKPEEFERSYLNKWIDAGVGETVVPWNIWLLCNEHEPVMDGPVWLCCDINPERTHASIVAAGANEDASKVSVRLLDYRPGVEWVTARVESLKSQLDVAGVVLDGSGPAATLENDLIEAPVMLKHGEVTLASQAFYDACLDLRVVLRQDPQLTAALRAANKFGSNDVWRWSRKRSRGDISPLVGATLAWWQARQELGALSLRIY
jgi:hypothetical protein